ncbi:MAG: cupredoxin domain-containing protein [bacterium]|nr:cupredoxin domain-containing protein [bacterium]
MPEEQNVQINNQPPDEEVKGSPAAIIAIVIVVAILAAFAVYASRGGFGAGEGRESDNGQNGSIDIDVDEVNINQGAEGESMLQQEDGVAADAVLSGEVAVNGSDEAQESPVASGESYSINITGKNFEFSDTEIRVKKGDTITVNFTSTDGFHDWMVPGLGVATDQVNTGESASVTFTAEEAGEFEYYCSVGSHRQLGMVGMLIIE